MSTATPLPPSPPAAFALWNLGFRPFYLLAGAFAALSIGWWVAQLASLASPRIHLASPLWHARMK